MVNANAAWQLTLKRVRACWSFLAPGPGSLSVVNSVAFISVLLFGDLLWASPFVIFQGRILKTNGEAIQGNVSFKIQILAPEKPNCVLYDETHEVPVENGKFALTIGDGVRTPGSPQVAEVFRN